MNRPRTAYDRQQTQFTRFPFYLIPYLLALSHLDARIFDSCSTTSCISFSSSYNNGTIFHYFSWLPGPFQWRTRFDLNRNPDSSKRSTECFNRETTSIGPGYQKSPHGLPR